MVDYIFPGFIYFFSQNLYNFNLTISFIDSLKRHFRPNIHGSSKPKQLKQLHEQISRHLVLNLQKNIHWPSIWFLINAALKNALQLYSKGSESGTLVRPNTTFKKNWSLIWYKIRHFGFN